MLCEGKASATSLFPPSPLQDLRLRTTRKSQGQEVRRAIYCSRRVTAFFLGPSWPGEKREGCLYLQRAESVNEGGYALYVKYRAKPGGEGLLWLLDHYSSSSPNLCPAVHIHPSSWGVMTAVVTKLGAAAVAQEAQVGALTCDISQLPKSNKSHDPHQWPLTSYHSRL